MPTTKAALAALTVSAVVAGAALGASPALAAGGSTCSYNPATRSVVVDDHSGLFKQLRIMRVGNQIRIADTDYVNPQPTTGTFCVGGPLQVATVTNTDQIVVFSNYSQLGDLPPADGFVVDESGGFLGPGATPEQDGSSEIEVVIHTAGTPARLDVIGTKAGDPTTHGMDEIRAGQGGLVNLGYRQFAGPDQDVDIAPDTPVTNMTLAGLDEFDVLSANGNEITHNLQPATAAVILSGGGDGDTLVGGLGQDDLNGGTGDDLFYSVDGHEDSISDEAGDDTATFDKSDFVQRDIEHRFPQ